MKIISSTQLKELDKYTIAKEPVASIDLMERAAEELTRAITHRWDTSFHIAVFAGPGNNGGDALAVARMLSKQNYHVEVFLFNTKGKLSEECQTNLERLKECGSVYFTEVSTQFDPPVLTERHLVVDGLFGSGLNKPLNGGFAAVVKYINASKAQVVAIDVPSGLMCEDNTYNIRQNMIRADVTLSIQLPKLSFLFPENEDIVGEWQLLDIQLKKDFIDTAQSPYYITEEEEIRSLIKPRKRFAHKGAFGHALLIAGSYGMAGASILSARACLRSGVGLLTVHVPIHNHDLLQTTVPEAIVQTDIHDHYFAEPVDTDRKAQRDAERARLKAEQQAADAVSYDDAVAALKAQKFVLEANQVMFRNGQTAFVTSNTNFVLVNQEAVVSLVVGVQCYAGILPVVPLYVLAELV